MTQKNWRLTAGGQHGPACQCRPCAHVNARSSAIAKLSRPADRHDVEVITPVSFAQQAITQNA